jgi:hypothetical protein
MHGTMNVKLVVGKFTITNGKSTSFISAIMILLPLQLPATTAANNNKNYTGF